MKGIELIATGRGTPGRLVTNDNLAQFVDTNDAWIRERTGIVSRCPVASQARLSAAS